MTPIVKILTAYWCLYWHQCDLPERFGKKTYWSRRIHGDRCLQTPVVYDYPFNFWVVIPETFPRSVQIGSTSSVQVLNLLPQSMCLFGGEEWVCFFSIEYFALFELTCTGCYEIAVNSFCWSLWFVFSNMCIFQYVFKTPLFILIFKLSTYLNLLWESCNAGLIWCINQNAKWAQVHVCYSDEFIVLAAWYRGLMS